MLRIQNTKVRPLPLTVSPEAFGREWDACILDRERDISTLLRYLDPFLVSWERFLLGKDQGSVIHTPLCGLLGSEYLQMIERWVAWATWSSSVKEELISLMILRIRHFYWKPNTDPINKEYLVCQDFRFALRDSMVVKNRQAYHELEFTGADSSQLSIQHNYFEDLKLSAWERYCLRISFEKSFDEIRAMTHNVFTVGENKKCQLIKTKLSNS